MSEKIYESQECLLGCHNGDVEHNPIGPVVRERTGWWLENFPAEGVPRYPGFRPIDFADQEDLLVAAVRVRAEQYRIHLIDPIILEIEEKYIGSEIPEHIRAVMNVLVETHCHSARHILETHLKMLDPQQYLDEPVGQSLMLYELKEQLPRPDTVSRQLQVWMTQQDLAMRVAVPLTCTCPCAGSLLTALETMFDKVNGQEDIKWNMQGVGQRAQDFLRQVDESTEPNI